MREQTADVVVVGAGPAGAAAAYFLARAGWDVVLLERGPAPHSKPCGEFLTPGAVDLLGDVLGVLPLLVAGGAVPVKRAGVTAHDGGQFSGRTDGLSCPRSVTDAAVRDAAVAAGARLLTGFSVRDIVRDGEHVQGVLGQTAEGELVRVRARVTVGADGTHSLVARALGVVRPLPHLQRIALVGHFADGGPLWPPPEPFPLQKGRGARVFSYPLSPVPTGERDGERGPSVAMHLPADGTDGCCGIGPPCGAHNVRNVNMVVPQSEAHKMAGRRETYFRERLRTAFPAAWETVRDMEQVSPLQSVGCFGHTTARATGHGAVLVGDAATFVHPFTGEGVYFALRGAQLAAEAINNALQTGDVSAHALSPYDAARRRELVPRYKLCGLVQRVTHAPRALALASGVLRHAPGLTDYLLSILGDRRRPAFGLL